MRDIAVPIDCPCKFISVRGHCVQNVVNHIKRIGFNSFGKNSKKQKEKGEPHAEACYGYFEQACVQVLSDSSSILPNSTVASRSLIPAPWPSIVKTWQSSSIIIISL